MALFVNIDETKTKQFKIRKTPGYLVGLARINAFIGVNNSGKSRFMRTLFYDKDNVKFYSNQKIKSDEFNKILRTIKTNYNSFLSNTSHYGVSLKEEYIYELSSINEDNIPRLIEIVQFFENLSEKSFIPEIIKVNRLYTIVKDFKTKVPSYAYHEFQKLEMVNVPKLYIPILRGLRPIQKEGENLEFTNNDSFQDRTRFDYFEKLPHNCSIYTGLTIYEDIMKLLLGQEEERQQIRDFEDFLGEEVFQKKITLIPKYKEDVLHIKIGNDDQFEIYNLGDGLQTLIAILFPIYIRKNRETLIFIEEPEVHLHPKWQVLLTNALHKFENHTFFISTHSASFINDSKTSTYSLNKKNNHTEVTYTNIESEKSQIIKDLGYKPSDLLQTNYILWVEGPSDRIYFNYWIQQMVPELIEGLHYSIMFYGGSNYKEFLKDGADFSLKFIRNLNQNFGIVLDSDRKGKYEHYDLKKKEIEDLFKSNDFFCWLTKYREIENYIPIDVFEGAVKKFHKKTNIEIGANPYDDRNTITDLDADPAYKSTIKLPPEIFKQIQKNKDGSTKEISAKKLRENIEDAIQKTAKTEFKINKVEVAKIISTNKPELLEPELIEYIKKLTNLIKKANNI